MRGERRETRDERRELIVLEGVPSAGTQYPYIKTPIVVKVEHGIIGFTNTYAYMSECIVNLPIVRFH